eukprot:695385-Rhodomonas_salina.5
MSAVSGYGAIEGERRNNSSRLNAPMAAVAFAACAAVLVIVVVTSQQSSSVELAEFPKTDLGLLRVLVRPDRLFFRKWAGLSVNQFFSESPAV